MSNTVGATKLVRSIKGASILALVLVLATVGAACGSSSRSPEEEALQKYDDDSSPLNIGTGEDITIKELVDYIDWAPLFHAWEMKGTYPKILDDIRYGDEARKLIDDGKELLVEILSTSSRPI